MSVIISHSLKDLPNLQIVSVIVSFDTDGNMQPLYVRIGEESYKILYCRHKPTIPGNCLFQCKIMDNDTLKDLELTYRESARMWSIPR